MATDDPLRALLASYAAALDRVEESPPVLWARWAPAPRPLVRLLVVRAVGRRVEALLRRSSARAAITAEGGDSLTRLERFARSLPSVPGMKVLAPLGLLGILLISYVFANHVAEAEFTALLGDLTSAAVDLDRGAAIDAFDRNELAAQYFIGTAIVLIWSAVVLILPVLPAFSVRRRLLREQDREARAFAAVGAQRVRDVELDLLVQLLLVAVVWMFGAIGLSAPLTDVEEDTSLQAIMIVGWITTVALVLVWTLYGIGLLTALTS